MKNFVVVNKIMLVFVFVYIDGIIAVSSEFYK